MLDGLTRLLPTAEVGFLGMVRNDETLEVTTYANRLPDDLTDRQCFVLDPMLATGHTLIASCEYLHDRGARDITCVTLLCAPEGLKRMEEAIDPVVDLTVVTAAIDEKLDHNSYIVPGIGDAGDRLFGVVDGSGPEGPRRHSGRYWVMRIWLPKGSRTAMSRPKGRVDGSSMISTPASRRRTWSASTSSLARIIQQIGRASCREGIEREAERSAAR